MKRYIKSDINSYSYTGSGFANDEIVLAETFSGKPWDDLEWVEVRLIKDAFICYVLVENEMADAIYQQSYSMNDLEYALADFNAKAREYGCKKTDTTIEDINKVLAKYNKSVADYLPGGFYDNLKTGVNSSTTVKASNDQSFEYQLLDRLRSDCDYVLNTYYRPEVQGDVSREERKLQQKFLWANNAKDQIAKMKELYRKLKVKPEWITLEDIAEYERRFKEILGKDYRGDHEYVGASNNPFYDKLSDRDKRFAKATAKRIANVVTIPGEAGTSLVIDMWYGDKFEPKKYAADDSFYGNDGEYRGNIYDNTGKPIGDYRSDNSVLIEKNFLIDFGD